MFTQTHQIEYSLVLVAIDIPEPRLSSITRWVNGIIIRYLVPSSKCTHTTGYFSLFQTILIGRFFFWMYVEEDVNFSLYCRRWLWVCSVFDWRNFLNFTLHSVLVACGNDAEMRLYHKSLAKNINNVESFSNALEMSGRFDHIHAFKLNNTIRETTQADLHLLWQKCLYEGKER